MQLLQSGRVSQNSPDAPLPFGVSPEIGTLARRVYHLARICAALRLFWAIERMGAFGAMMPSDTDRRCAGDPFRRRSAPKRSAGCIARARLTKL
jgi:hypothetical protein